MKKSEEILKRNITKFTEFEENDNPSIPYKDALKAVEEALQQAKNNESLHIVSKTFYCADPDKTGNCFDRGFSQCEECKK